MQLLRSPLPPPMSVGSVSKSTYIREPSTAKVACRSRGALTPVNANSGALPPVELPAVAS